VRHRDEGLLGISLATAMLFLGLMAAVDSAKRAAAAGFAQDGIRFMIVPAAGVVMFALLVGLAIFFVKNKDIHKR
jgi:Ni,Fe-hydrogenase I cytochrome b subunit